MYQTEGQKKASSLEVSSRVQIILAFCSFILVGANDGAFGVLLPEIGLHYHIETAIIGELFLATSFGFLITAFVGGFLLKRLGECGYLLLGSGCFLGSCILVSLMPPFWLVVGILIFFGFGASILISGLNAFIALLPKNRMLLNYLHAFYSTGNLLGPLVATTILTLNGSWNSVYVVWSGLCTFICLGWFMVLKKFPLQKVQFQEDSQQRNLLKHTLRLPTVWFVAFFLLLCVGIEMSLGRWGYSFLVEARHGDPLLMGWVISGLGLGLMLSRFVFANIAQHMSGKILLQLCLIGVLLGIAWVWLSPQSSMAGLGFCLIGFSLGPIFPTTVSLLPRAVAQSLLPQAIGFIAGIANISSGLFPWAGGTVIQFFGFQSLLAYAFFLLVTAQILYIFLQGRFHMYP